MPSIDSAHPQKVDDMLRNQWTTCSGFGGRLAPDSLVAFDRITQVVRITSSGRVTKLLKTHPQGITELCLADAVIALNSGIYKELTSIGIKPQSIKSIPNGVDLNAFYPIQKRLDWNERTRLVFFSPSRLDYKKRIFDLMCLWNDISALGRNQICELWILGGDWIEDSQVRIFGELVRQVERMNKQDCVKIQPGVPHAKMPQYYQAADIYITLSTEEGMSNAMLEAMATGLIVIAPAIDGVTTLIKDGWNGFLFVPGNLSSAREAISRLLKTAPQQLDAMSNRNRQLACLNYNIDDVALAFSDLFNSLVG